MKKIMFNSKLGLEQAVLEGRKTQTRRIIDKTKNEYFLNLMSDEGYMKYTGTLSYDKEFGEFRIDDVYECTTCRPMYKLGEVVAIAQSYHTIYDEFGLETMDMLVTKLKESKGWTNKMFIKPEIMSHQIRITNVRIERLQDISNEDCLKEGVVKCDAEDCNDRCYLMSKCDFCHCGNAKYTPREAYAALIDKVSGKGTFERNPYVFVYDFELVK